MKIPLFPFEEVSKSKPNNPFPPHISENANVLYHGTSCINESAIEKSGLTINTSIFSKEELEEVCTLFDCVNWPYKRFVSEIVLRNYSLNHDYKNPELKPIYLGECVDRVSLYASREFAGGEIARAIRNSFLELERLIKDPKELKNELIRIEKEAPFTFKTLKDFNLSLEELEEQLGKKKNYLTRAMDSLNSFQYGVIYAIELEEKDYSSLEFSLQEGMGVKCFNSISKNKIVGKTIVPENYLHNNNNFVKYWELPSMKGILTEVRNDRGINLKSYK